MNNIQIRHSRIMQLFQFAVRGATKKQIINKALSMGVTKKTANEYYDSVHAMELQNKK